MKKGLSLSAILILIIFSVKAQVDLNLGLRAYYPFTGNANDVSGNNNNPVFNNATLTADRFGNPNEAYHFNGTDNYMQIANNATLNMGNKMSIALWVKPTGYNTGTCYNNMCVMKSNPATLPSNYFIRFADVYNGCTSPSTTQERFAGNNAVAPTPFVQLNQWYSVVWTSDGVTERIYVNCELKASVPAGAVPYSNMSDLLMGKNVDPSFPYWLNGDLDEIRLYDRALNADEVNTLGGCITATPCNNWLNTPGYPSYARIGDLDVSGNQITVEATYNRTQPLNGGLYPGHLVSKHTNAADINYALFPNGCSITTTNGYKETFENCALALNKTYHVAMVYDGSFLKFYRNGFLHSQVACTGNMALNNLQATIAQYAGAAGTNEQFLGQVNEVRIWNVARTQAQLQTYMNNTLPNPTTIPGLLGYYTFDNLLNKQGNAAFNATLVGSATINAGNTNCTFIADSCAYLPCDSWLRTQIAGQSVTVGDLDVSGNQMTIEGNFNCTAFPPAANGNIWEEIISKHHGAADCNYSLRMNMAAITTTNGFFRTPSLPSASCDSIFLNKTYHAAMVYNGSTLKFYRNGFLMSQVAATGNLVLNNLLATIGDYASVPQQATNFQGYLNEIRIWNVARTQSQIRTYMNASLPNPATQTGLLGYYTFNSLINKQGNATWNGTLNGGATINNTNPNCTFTDDSCAVTPTPAIINDYTPVLALNPCNNTLTVEDATAYKVGDTVLLIQMKGAVIDSTNTAAFGSITNYKNAGNYEFNYVKSKTGNNIELKNTLTRQYDVPVGKVQLIRVPYYTNLSTTSTLTCLPWNGNKGGVLVFNVQNALTLNADMDVSGRGFSGGIDPVSNPAVFNCNENQFYYPANPDLASGKGEGIADISTARSFGKGALANGGGGGNSHNSGGAGGGNISTGGLGGYQFEGSPCNGTVPFDNRGIGGNGLTYSNGANKIFLGGGGGAGHTNNPEAFQARGGNGAGIIIVSAGSLTSNTKKIIANGNDATACGAATSGCHEGMGGGGAAGTILLKISTYLDNSVIENKGGKGGNMTAAGFSKVGPGGGGSGGPLWLSNASLPANIAVVNTGGINGVCTGYSNNAWGATSGNAGQNLFNLVLPVDNIPFQKNIDSVRIKDSLLTCMSLDFKGLAYINTNPINSWQWYFGDGGTANTQNTSHVYTGPGTYSVKLVVTDMNDCKDSITKNITTSVFAANAGNDTSVCTAPAVSVTLHASTGAAYSWAPAALLNNPAVQHPVATISATTTFYVTITSVSGCSATDSVVITLAPALTPAVTISSAANNVCTGTPVTFTAVTVNGGMLPSFQWQKNGNPVGSNSNTYTDLHLNNGDVIKCILTSNLNCAVPTTVQSNSITMAISSAPVNVRYPALSAFPYQQLQLQARTNIGALSYQWLPNTGISNNLIYNPVFYYSQSQEYNIRMLTASGCTVVDTLLVEIKGNKGIYVPRGFSPNTDGSNDRLYPILIGIKQLSYFKIYNRWGNLVFETTSGNPANGWDGTFKGKPQPVETYTWVVQGIDIDNIVITKSGNTLLIR